MSGEGLTLLPALALVALGGALGSIARVHVTGVVGRRFGEAFPWGTLAVNVTGAAAIGVLAALLLAPDGRVGRQEAVWFGLVAGVLGSYTTVSSFSLQTLVLARNGRPGWALANVGLSLVLCLAAAGGGWLATARAIAAWGAP